MQILTMESRVNSTHSPLFVSSFHLILSLCIPPLSSCPKYRIMTQFSRAVRGSRETVTMATAPVLLSRPTVVWAWVRCIVLATLEQTFVMGLFVLHACWCASEVRDWLMSLFLSFDFSCEQLSSSLCKGCGNHADILHRTQLLFMQRFKKLAK